MNNQASFRLRQRNPDVLSCIANLSNDEVFTPPEFANAMLDALSEAWAEDNGGDDLWRNKQVKFLDPCTKSGVFLREITRRLSIGLSSEFPDLAERVDHILTNQVYGIGLTNLTSLLARRSLYCSKHADGEHSVATSFNNSSGNIWFQRTEHSWSDGSCIFCNAGQHALDRGELAETHAYAFIHSNKISTRINQIFGGSMQFDVIIGNPPYQLSDSGYGKSASPIYQKFVEQAKNLNPRYLSMVIPARWYAGGKGLDTFRSDMLNDKRVRKLYDFENSSEFFPGVDVAGGICYFLWNRDNPGLCSIVNVQDEKKVTDERALNEFHVLIRHSRAVPIIRKVMKLRDNQGRFLSNVVSSRKPFGLPTNYKPTKDGIPCWFTQKIGLKFADKAEVRDSGDYLNSWKVLIPPAPIAGQTDFSKPIGFYSLSNTRISKPGECCTESWLVAGAFETEAEAISFRSYLFTKVVRFLLLQTVVSQHVTKEKFSFVPALPEYKGLYDDDALCKEWGINKEEWAFIDSKIKHVELSDAK